MRYKVESIGAAFGNKDIDALAGRFSNQSSQGWELHSVFSVEKRGCFGASEGTTYLAIYRQND